MNKVFKAVFLLAIGIILFQSFAFRSMIESDACEELYQIMNKQQEAWNTGNIDAFMEGYWKNDSLQFIGKSGITRGWQATLDNYKKSYPNPEAMGQLQFNNLECADLKNDYHYVVGQWTLYRSTDTLQGYYSLLWKNINNEWVIVRDHSS